MTFELMKRKREMLIKIILLLVVFLSARTEASTRLIFETNSVEFLCVTNDSGETFSSDNNLIIEDLFDQTDRIIITEEHSYSLSVLQNFSQVHNFSHSVWQPPKIC
jgi:hypothetical protein